MSFSHVCRSPTPLPGDGDDEADGAAGTRPAATDESDGDQVTTAPPPVADPAASPMLADVVLAAAALLLLIANAPQTMRGSPVLLTAVVFPLGGAGLVSLAVLAHRRDRAAIWGAAFLGWSLISVALSGQPRLSFEAGWSGDRGWIYLACYLGLWALGRRRGTAGTRLVAGAILVGLVANALLAYLQVAVGTGTGIVSLYDGRAMGFTLNPVLLGGLMAGGVAMVGSYLGRSPGRWLLWAPLVVALAAAGNMAGSRVSFVGMLVFGPLAAGLGARRRIGGRRAAVRAGVVLAAVAVGMVIGAATIQESATTRLGTGSGQQSRLIMWKAAAPAVGEKPVFGWGPNRFRSAANHRTTAAFARAEGADRTYADAHNLPIELAVTTGLPGLALAAGFGWFAARRARGPLAWYAAGVALSWLLEPFAVATAPTALLALGLAAVASDPPVPPDPPTARRGVHAAELAVAAVLALVGLGLGAQMIYADHLVALAQTDRHPLPLARRATEVMADPGIIDLYGRLEGQRGILERDPEAARIALEQAERAVAIEPRYWYFWSELGVARQSPLLSRGKVRFERSREAFMRAYELNPWSFTVLRQLYFVDRALGRDADVARWRAKLCELDACPPPVS